MRNLKVALLTSVFLFLAYITVGQAIDILDPATPIPFEEKGGSWEHPSAIITGDGELKIKDSSLGEKSIKYEGIISCEVTASAALDEGNKVEIKMEDASTEVEAKSKIGNIDISYCTMTDEYGNVTDIAESILIPSGKVKVEVEGFAVDGLGNLSFTEYEAKGKVASGKDPRVKLELKNGSIELVDIGLPSGSACTLDSECASNLCYIPPFQTEGTCI